MGVKKSGMEERANEIMRIAETYGAEKNYLFLTTFAQLQDTMAVLDMLMEEVRSGGATVTKQYVKNRENRYSNPAIADYNKTMKTYNDTCTVLMKIIDGFKADAEDPESEDPLLTALRGGDAP